MEQVRLCAVRPMKDWLGTYRTTLRVGWMMWICYSRALERRPLFRALLFLSHDASVCTHSLSHTMNVLSSAVFSVRGCVNGLNFEFHATSYGEICSSEYRVGRRWEISGAIFHCSMIGRTHISRGGLLNLGWHLLPSKVASHTLYLSPLWTKLSKIWNTFDVTLDKVSTKFVTKLDHRQPRKWNVWRNFWGQKSPT